MRLTILSSKENNISDIAQRVIALSDCYATDKEFLEKCEINNYSLVTDLRKGRVDAPGAGKLAQIVRGTGCNGTWLLTGKGEMFPSNQPEMNPADFQETLVKDFLQAVRLIESVEQSKDALKDISLPDDLPMKFLRLTTTLFELQQESDNDLDE